MTIPTLSVSKLSAIPLTPDLNSTISPACTLVRPNTLAIPSPIEMTEPNSFKSFYIHTEKEGELSVFVANEVVHNKIDIYKDACTIRSKSYGGTPLIQDS